MDFESVRVSYCCKTVSRSNFWRKDLIVKTSLFVYTNDIFQTILHMRSIHSKWSAMKTSLNLLVIHGQISDGKKILHKPLSFGNANYAYLNLWRFLTAKSVKSIILFWVFTTYSRNFCTASLYESISDLFIAAITVISSFSSSLKSAIAFLISIIFGEVSLYPYIT